MSCSLKKKKELWANILILKDTHRDGEWIIGGDFNTTKNQNERKGRSERALNNGSELFGKFIEDNGLVDIPCKGKIFSWYTGDERSMSRINCFLVSNVVVYRWGLVANLLGVKTFQINVRYGW